MPKNSSKKLLPDNNTKDYTFYADVYEVVKRVPKGRVTTYGAIAKYLGAGSSARVVGWALNGSHLLKPKVPAQRVVNRTGMLSGKMHFGSATKMEELLKKDGVIVKDDTVVNFNEIFWDPALELGL